MPKFLDKIRNKLRKSQPGTAPGSPPPASPADQDNKGEAAKQKDKPAKAEAKPETPKRDPLPPGAYVRHLPLDMGSISLFYSKEDQQDIAGNLVFFEDCDTSNVPGHKYSGQGTINIGKRIGADSALFYKFVSNAVQEAKRQKMSIKMIDPEGCNLSLQLVFHMPDNSLVHVRKTGDTISAADLNVADAMIVCNASQRDFETKKMSRIQFIRPSGPNLYTTEF